jgi:hypothetical protein
VSNTDEDLVKQDADRVRKMAREITAELGNVMDVAGPEDDTSHYGDGARVMISFHIGSRRRNTPSHGRYFASDIQNLRSPFSSSALTRTRARFGTFQNAGNICAGLPKPRISTNPRTCHLISADSYLA